MLSMRLFISNQRRCWQLSENTGEWTFISLLTLFMSVLSVHYFVQLSPLLCLYQRTEIRYFSVVFSLVSTYSGNKGTCARTRRATFNLTALLRTSRCVRTACQSFYCFTIKCMAALRRTGLVWQGHNNQLRTGCHRFHCIQKCSVCADSSGLNWFLELKILRRRNASS